MNALNERRPDSLEILVVDDDPEIFQEVQHAIGNENASYTFCTSVEEVAKLDQPLFAACILDIRFQNGTTRIPELLSMVRQRWKKASVVVLSGFTADLDPNDARDAIILTKPRFRLNPESLPEALASSFKITGTIPVLPVQRLKALHVEQSTSLRDSPEIELFRMRGFIVGIHDPFVDVVVEEVAKGESLLKRLFTRDFMDVLRSPGTSKKLRMNYSAFQAIGLGQDMWFVYRIFRKGAQVTAEIIADEEDSPAQTMELKEHEVNLLDLEDREIQKALLEKQHGQ